jgi:predicted nucleotide-binding protein (sugar kinase/HSP70/actin superfamily)
MNNQTSTPTKLPDGDMAYTILSDLKRVTREYATAATESVCPEIRQMFTQLLNNTLQMQGELFNVMQQNNMYNASSPALKQEMDKQIKQYQQTQQKTNQFVQQTQSSQGKSQNQNQNQSQNQNQNQSQNQNQGQVSPGAMGQNTNQAFQQQSSSGGQDM